MKNTILTCTIILVVLQASAQKKQHQSLEIAVNSLVEAMLHADRQKLIMLSDDRLSYGHSSGKIEDKKEFVETIASGASVFEKIDISDQQITVVGNTGVVRHILHATTNDPGKGTAQIKIGIILTWIKEGDTWKLLARQAFKV